ncbi:MAG: MFS transporter [Coriobacteriales bacterium]|jgi:MFS family permease|nr:MFS transporter [Coriobacteriales bacterium]
MMSEQESGTQSEPESKLQPQPDTQQPGLGQQSQPQSQPQQQPQPQSRRQQIMKLAVAIIVVEFVSGFTQGFYEPLIPKFGELLSVDASGLQLFNVIPTAVAALFVPFLTRLGDIKGYRKILRIVVATVFVATILIMLGTMLQSWALVLFGRLLNGPIAVWLPLHIALVHSRAEGKSATTAVSMIIATLAVGTVIGTASSGFIFALLDNNLAQTLIIVPLLQVIAVAIVVFVMPEYVSGAHPHIDAKGFIVLGVIMFVAILGFVEVVVGGLDTVIGVFCLLASAVIGVVWYRMEKRTEHPAIDVRVLFSRRLAPLYVSAICYGAVFYGFLAPVATFLAADPGALGFGYGFAPSSISIAQTLILIATVIAALVLPLLITRTGSKAALVLGFALAAVGFLQWALLDDSILKLALFIVLIGLGTGVVSAAIPVIIPQRSPQEQRGVATGLFNSSQTLGGALGGGLFISLLKVGASSSGTITSVGYTVVWLTCALIMVLGLLVVLVFLAGEKNMSSRAAGEKNTISREREQQKDHQGRY